MGVITMVTQPQYILAKYVPEVTRNEPKNFGVVLWTRWGVMARFLGEENGLLDGRKKPAWIQSWDAYREWVHHWRIIVRRGYLAPRDGGRTNADTVDFLDALSRTSKSNYALGDKGIVLEDVSKQDCQALLDYLFETLVETESDMQSAKSAFDIERECNRIIRGTHAIKHDHFFRDKSVFCRIAGSVMEEFAFNYYVGNGEPDFLYQRVPLGGRLETSLNATAWQFEQVIKQKIVTKKSSAAIIMPTDEQREDDRVQRAISILKTQTRVFDLPKDGGIFAEEINKSLAKHS